MTAKEDIADHLLEQVESTAQDIRALLPEAFDGAEPLCRSVGSAGCTPPAASAVELGDTC